MGNVPVDGCKHEGVDYVWLEKLPWGCAHKLVATIPRMIDV